jgi:CRP-like cAMP-binding protein
MNSEPLIKYLLQFGTLNPQQIELINSLLTEREMKPGDYLLKAGKVSNEFAFVTKGVFRICYYDQDGNENTRYFIDEEHFIVDLESYNSNMPSAYYVEALTDAMVLVLSREALDALSKTIMIWDKLVQKIMVRILAVKGEKTASLLSKDATERYAFFLEKFPNIANRVPLQYIASYIGVTKHSLSRIRKNMKG